MKRSLSPALRRTLYYGSPFVLTPLLCFALELLPVTPPALLPLLLFLFAAVFGTLSGAPRAVDFGAATVLPAAFFLTMLLAGFLDRSDLGSRFSLGRALEVALQPFVLVLCAGVAAVALLSSLRPLRIRKRIRA